MNALRIQDASGCEGKEQGLTIRNNGGAEINRLRAAGYDLEPEPGTLAVCGEPRCADLLFGRAEGGNSHLRVAFVGVALCASGQMCRQMRRLSVCGDAGPAIEFTLTGNRQGFRAFGEEMSHIRLGKGQGMGTAGNRPLFQKATTEERKLLQGDGVSVE